MIDPMTSQGEPIFMSASSGTHNQAKVKRDRRRSPVVSGTIAIAAGWGMLLLFGLFRIDLPLYVLWLIAGTIATAFAFTYDKFQAKRRGNRIPEVVLLGASLAGGVLGGWFGMLAIRHKTLHRRFWVVQWLSTALHAGLGWFLLIA